MLELLHRLARWVAAKTQPVALAGNPYRGTGFVDAYRRRHEPRPADLLEQLKNTAGTCAALNAAACASYPPRLYVTTSGHQAKARCPTQRPAAATLARLKRAPHLGPWTRHADSIEEVLDHPLLDLLRSVNVGFLNGFDLLELTTLYQEVLGSAYWYLQPGPLGVPEAIWVLPAQNVTPARAEGSPRLIDSYDYQSGRQVERYTPEEVIHFRYPDPRHPYQGGLAPLHSCYENAALTSEYTAFRSATYANHALPSAVVSPAEVIGEAERDRLEAQWNQKYRQGGAGKVLVAESAMKVDLLSYSLGDLAALAEYGKTKEDIANAFGVPLAFLTSDTNLANLQAAEYQHMTKTVAPRLRRRDEKLNEQLVPLFDPSGRLFLCSEDPTPLDRAADLAQERNDLQFGVLSLNEVRARRGLPPVAWGEVPWLSSHWWPTTQTRGVQHIFSDDADLPNVTADLPPTLE